MEARILFAGDVVVAPNTNISGCSIIDPNIKGIIQNADYSIVNFEAPVKTQYSIKITKTGPNIHQHALVIDALKHMGFNCFTLANNHFRDYGGDACENTLTLLQAKGVDYVGAGINSKKAGEILYKEINGNIVAFINVCEVEWSIATETRAGSNPVDPVTQYYQINEAKNKADFVIVIYHGGTECYQFPSPRLKQLHHFFIDAGADAVINHHQHCISGYEVYNGKPIFYGIGNFLFDNPQSHNSSWNYGYIVLLKLDSQKKSVDFDLYPFEQCREHFGVFQRPDSDSFISEIAELSSIIADDFRLKQCWDKFVADTRSAYMPVSIPYHSRIMNKLCRMKIIPTFMSNEQLRFILDVVNCDSHRDRFIDYLQDVLKIPTR